MRAWRTPTAGVAVAVCVAGCGAGAEPPAAAPHARPAAHQSKPKLLYVWRNFEETGVPEEMTIYRDGTLRYRNLLHTQMGIKVITSHLDGAQLARMRRLVRAVDLRHTDASGVKPRRDGFRYVLRRDGRVGTAADGHLSGPVRPLVLRLRGLMDKLQTSSL
jgi:hypothetical protein